ncbi:MAG: hypothetical protein JO154_25675 [Chitinophaga sp.]|uniref:hypothetical protein n=1 Tax=Chitinophaga sp. TaxID=1869181 RepID=UPI0025BD8654|nr:hypothetical protein [Chitinophaga sp.]MBV8256011.1 hypothetical protein [Chitinophaga sp.]
MFKPLLYTAIAVSLLTACSKSDKSTVDNSNQPVDSIAVQISGSVNKQFKIAQKSTVGYTKFTKTGFETFTITADLDSAGKAYHVSCGALPMQLIKGEQVFDGMLSTGGQTTIGTSNDRKDYSGGMYFLYFDTDINRTNSKVHMNLTDITDMGKYLRLRGSYNYNAAYASADLSMPCIQDMLANSGRQPAYNAPVCGAQDIHVNATFTVYIDKITQQ